MRWPSLAGFLKLSPCWNELWDRPPLPVWLVALQLYVAWVSEVYLRAGHLAHADTIAVQALILARVHKERGTEAWTLRLLGDIAARCEPPDSALAAAHYQQSLALAEELGMRPLQAHCYLGLGSLYSQTGQAERARAALAAAIDLYRAMEMTFWLPQAEAALAQVEGR